MPLLVVGADTPAGQAIVSRMLQEGGELRVFVSDPGEADRLRAAGAKVALGDVSDTSHIEGAATGAHTIVFVAAALVDGRERAFADTATGLGQGWVAAARDAGARRVVWVGSDPPPDVIVVPDDPSAAEAVAQADAAR